MRTLLFLSLFGLIEGGAFYLVARVQYERGYSSGLNQGYPEGVRWALVNARGLPATLPARTEFKGE